MVKSPKLAAIGVATLSGLILRRLDKTITATIMRPIKREFILRYSYYRSKLFAFLYLFQVVIQVHNFASGAVKKNHCDPSVQNCRNIV